MHHGNFYNEDVAVKDCKWKFLTILWHLFVYVCECVFLSHLLQSPDLSNISCIRVRMYIWIFAFDFCSITTHLWIISLLSLVKLILSMWCESREINFFVTELKWSMLEIDWQFPFWDLQVFLLQIWHFSRNKICSKMMT